MVPQYLYDRLADLNRAYQENDQSALHEIEMLDTLTETHVFDDDSIECYECGEAPSTIDLDGMCVQCFANSGNIFFEGDE